MGQMLLALGHATFAERRGALREATGTGTARGTGRGRAILTLPLRLALPALRLPGR